MIELNIAGLFKGSISSKALNVLGKSNVVLGLGAIITVSVAAYLFTHPEELEKVIESLKGTKPQKTKEPENSSIPSHKALNNKSIQIIDNLKRGEIKKIKKEFVNDHINNVQDLEEKVIKAQELLKTFNIKNPENPIEVIKSTNTNDKNINIISVQISLENSAKISINIILAYLKTMNTNELKLLHFELGIHQN